MTRRASALVGMVSLAILVSGLLIAALIGSSGGRGAQRQWTAPERVPIPAAAAPTATAIVDPAGRVHVAFVERRRGTSSLYEVVREPGGRWTAPTAITTASPFSITISGLAANARGDASVLWAYGAERRQVLVASTRLATGNWSAEQALSRASAALAFGRIATDARSVTTVVGRGLDGPGLWALRRTPSDGWSGPARISPPGARTDAPTLALSSDGRAEVVALLKQAGEPRVLWSRGADASGRWGPAARLPGSGLATNATLATSADGSVVASWVRQSEARAQRVAATRSGNRDWSAPVVLDDLAGQLWGPSVSLAEPAGASVVWVRWDARPEDRRVSLRSATLGTTAPAAPRILQSLRLAPVQASPGSVTIYGSPPVDLGAASGREPVIVWSATSADRPDDPAALSVSSRGPDGSWSPVKVLSAPGRGAYPIAVGATPEGSVTVWSEAPPLGPPTALFVAERR